MKRNALITLAVIMNVFTVTRLSVGQTPPGEQVISRGADYRRCLSVAWFTNQAGQASLRTNRYSVLEQGMHRWSGAQWVPSSPQLIPTNGAVLAVGARHSALLPSNIRLPLLIRSSSGQIFRSKIFGLAYHDVSSGTNVLIAELKDSNPVISGPATVLYPDAFDDVSASVRLSYTKAGVESDVVLTALPPRPEEWGLNPDRTHLLVITEVLEAPTPNLKQIDWASGEEILHDQIIEFGQMRMVPGWAFPLHGGRRHIRVGKSYEDISGRHFVVERVRFRELEPELRGLPISLSGTNSPSGVTTNSSLAKPVRWFAQGTLPALRDRPEAKPSSQAVRTASIALAHGFVIDWTFVDQLEFTFNSGETTVVQGDVHLSYGTFQPNAVLKYDCDSSLWVDGPFVWSNPYNMEGKAVLTSVHDDDNGQPIEWSQHDPWYCSFGRPALGVRPQDYQSALDHCSVLYADQGVVAQTVTIKPGSDATKQGAVGHFTIFRSGGDSGLPLNVQLTVDTGAGAAQPGVDYQALPSVVTIPAGFASKTIDVTALSGTINSRQSPIKVTLGTDSQYLVGSPDHATIYVLDSNSEAFVPPPVSSPSGLVAWWRAEQNLNDSSGSGFNGDAASTVQYGPGEVGAGFSFDGNQRFTMSSPGLDFGAGQNFTVEAWVRPVEASTTWGIQSIIDKRTAPSSNDRAVGFEVCLADGRVSCQLADQPLQPGNFHGCGPAGPDLRDGAYHHVAFVADRTSAITTGGKLFVDGVPVTDFDARSEPGNLSCPDPLRIGNHANIYLNAFFKGTIDEVSIYNRALSQAEIQTLQTSGCGGKTVNPVITTQPADQTVARGQSASFSVVAAGLPPVTYQWKKDGINIQDATSATYTIASAQPTDAADYSVWVTAASVSVLSSPAHLSLKPSLDLGHSSVSYAAFGPPLTLADSGQALDAGSTMFTGWHLVIAIEANAQADDQLTVRHQGTASGQIGVAGSQIFYGTFPVATFTGGQGSTPLDIAFTATTCPDSIVQAVLRNVQYSYFPSGAPSQAARTVAFSLVNPSSVTTSTANLGINVSAATMGFLKGVNLGGSAVTIDGHQWMGDADAKAAGLLVSPDSTKSVAIDPIPAVDAAKQTMLCSFASRGVSQGVVAFNYKKTDTGPAGIWANKYVQFPEGPSLYGFINGWNRSWCIDKTAHDVKDDLTAVHHGELTYSYATLPTQYDPAAMRKINYILNHKASASPRAIQWAIWDMLGEAHEGFDISDQTEFAAYQGLTNSANANGSAFIPSEQQIGGVLLVPTGPSDGMDQALIVERPAALGLTLPLANGDYSVFLWVAENETSNSRLLDVRVQGALVATGAGCLALNGWSKLGPFPAAVIDGLLTIRVSASAAMPAGSPLLMGLEVYGTTPRNQAPVVDAGPDQTISLPQTTALRLSGVVLDPDGPAGPTIAWKKLDGPGAVLFEPPPPPDTDPAHIHVRFSAAGDYTLQLSASDSQLTGHDEVTIHVTAVNQAPTVNAGPDQALKFPARGFLQGTVSDDGLPAPANLVITWANVSTEVGNAIFDDAHSASTFVGFDVPGAYTLRLTASDGERSTSDDVVVTVQHASNTNTWSNVDVASAAVGYLMDAKQRVLRLEGVSGPVKQAYLYWNGKTDSSDPSVNATVSVNGRLVTGTIIAISSAFDWNFSGHLFANSHTYRADVTPLVAVCGNGDYVLREFTKCEEVTANGASLVVLFDKPGSTSKRDVVLVDGCDGNFGSAFYFDPNQPPNAMALQPDGKMIFGGGFLFPDFEPLAGLVRFHKDGTLDRSFDPGGGVNGRVHALSLQPDGKIVIAGYFSTYDGIARANIARVLSNGAIDGTFTPDKEPDASIYCMALQDNGKILVGGAFTAFGGTPRMRLARLNYDGTLDTTFDPSALKANAPVNALLLQPDGKIVVAGDFSTAYGANRSGIARLDADGSLDTTFNSALGIEGHVYALSLDQAGKILVGGEFSHVGSQARNCLARLESNGSLDASFMSNPGDGPAGGGGLYPRVTSIVTQSSGNILIGGWFSTMSGVSRANIVRLLPTGSVDTSFATAADGDVNMLCLGDNDEIYLAGDFHNVGGKARTLFARLEAEGQLSQNALYDEWYTCVPVPRYPTSPTTQGTLELHVSDGQFFFRKDDYVRYFLDPTVTINGLTWLAPENIPACDGSYAQDLQLFPGNLGCNVEDTTQCRSLWDVREGSLSGFLAPSSVPQPLLLETTGAHDDQLGLILALAKLPVGSVPQPSAAVAIPPNLPPVARADQAVVPRGIGIAILDVLANDSAPDGKCLTIISATTPLHGYTEVVYERSAILYRANPNYGGTDSFSYTIADSAGNTSTAAVNITVSGTQDPLRLTCNNQESGTLTASGPTTTVRGANQPAAFYRFEAAAGALLSVKVEHCDFRSHVYVRDPYGRLVGSGSHFHDSNNDLFESRIDSLPLEMSGPYTIEVTSHSPRSAGNFLITAYTTGPSGPCAPESRLEVWVDGVKVPYGGVIDLGAEPSKAVTIVNTGNAGEEGALAVGVTDVAGDPPTYYFSCTPDNLNPTPLAPNAIRTVTVNFDGTTAAQGQHRGSFSFGYPGLYYVELFKADVIAYVNPAGPAPTVSVLAPAPNSVFYSPATFVISAEPHASGAAVSKVEFFATGSQGSFKLGEASTAPYSCTWRLPPNGSYGIYSWVTDSAGRMGKSAAVPVNVCSRPPNQPPKACNDTAVVLKGSKNVPIPVLANDSDPNGDQLTIINASAQNGHVEASADGKTLLYTPLDNSYGEDIVQYTITDGRNGYSTAKVYVTVIQTTVQIDQPADGSAFGPNAAIPIEASAETSDGAIVKVEFFANNQKIGESATAPYSINWTTTGPRPAGRYMLKAVALDSAGFVSTSEPVRIRVGDTMDQPIAEIANLTDGQILQEGSFELRGTAANGNPAAFNGYRITVCLPNDGTTPEEERIVWHTDTRSSPVTDNTLEHLDFSTLRNGAYVLELTVFGNFQSLSQQVRFILENSLKVGNFTFTEQDLVLPVNGIPLAVMRTYNSLNPAQGDFGYAWTFSLADLEVQIDEERDPNTEDILGKRFNMRVGGGRDVTLTLPDGRRTTFYFYLEPGDCNSADEASFCYFAKWRPAPGVTATLELLNPDEGKFVCFWNRLNHWQAYPQAGVDNFDFSGFLLRTLDGTEYRIEREGDPQDPRDYYDRNGAPRIVVPYGRPMLKTITTKAGNRIEIDDTRTHVTEFSADNVAVRSLVINRDYDHGGRIVDIRDPKTLTSTFPAVKYDYDSTTGNLKFVKRLINGRAGPEADAYGVTRYYYNYEEPNPLGAPRPELAHFITRIDDPRQIPQARNLYDDCGRLLQITDPFGKITKFEHDLDNRKEVITDALGKKTTHFYDERGNIVTTINPLSQTSSRTYDSTNHVLSETDTGSYTTRHTYDGQTGLLVSTTDPLNHTTRYTYTTLGSPATITDPRGNTKVIGYNSAGQPETVTETLDGTPIVSTYHYDALTHNLSYTEDALGNKTVNDYDNVGNVTSVTFRASTDAVLKQTVYGAKDVTTGGYDQNGNRLSEWTVQTAVDGSRTTVFTQYVYDEQDRLLFTLLPVSDTNKKHYAPGTKYNALGKAEASTNMFGGVTFYIYDARGSLIQTETPDKKLTRTVYDDVGRAVFTTDPHDPPVTGTRTTANGNRTVFDDLGRVIRSERVKDVQTELLDPQGLCRMVLLNNPAALSSSITSYDDAGRVAATTNSLGVATLYRYDDAGRRMAVRDTLGSETIYGYDDNGNQTSFTDAAGRTTTYVYDGLNRRTEVRLPDVGDGAGRIQRTLYDVLGRRWLEIDLSGKATAYAYDGLGRLVWVVTDVDVSPQPPASLPTPLPSTRSDWEDWARGDRAASDSTATHYVYDELGNLIRQQDANGNETTFVYDGISRRTRRTLPGAAAPSEVTTYDIVPNPGWPDVLRRKVVDFKGQTIYYFDDVMSRLQRKVYGTDPANAAAVTFTYHPSGQRATMTDSTGTTQYQYDDYNRLTQKQVPFEGSDTFTINYKNDSQGNLTELRSSSPYLYNYATVNYLYDALGRLEWVKTGGNPIEQYGYDTVGNLQNSYVTLSGSAVRQTHYNYDARNRLTDMVLTRQPDNTTLANFLYDPSDRRLDPTGVRLAAQEIISTTINRHIYYYYDALYRLTKEQVVSGSPGGTITYDDQVGYADTTAGLGFDKVGNRKSRTSTVTGVTAYTGHAFDERDRLTSGYTYDDNGNTLQGPVTPAPAPTADDQYDPENRLVKRTTASSTVEVIYDGDGQRVAKETTAADATTITRYVVDDRNPSGYAQVLVELSKVVPLRLQAADISRADGLCYLIDNGHSVSPSLEKLLWDALTAEEREAVHANALDSINHPAPVAALVRVLNGLISGSNLYNLVPFQGIPLAAETQALQQRNPSGPALQRLNLWLLVDAFFDDSYGYYFGGHTPYTATRKYVYGHTRISQDRWDAGRSSWLTDVYGYDGHGNVRLLTDTSGNITDTYVYDAFGILIDDPASHPTANNYLYCGEQWDPDLGMYYLRARYYSPQVARFWTMDSLEGAQTEPSGLHKYLYAANNPANNSDPTGMFTQRFGYVAEAAIQAIYAIDHPASAVAYGRWTRLGGRSNPAYRLKPDIFNTTTKVWAEIKPFSYSGIVAGAAQYATYLAALGPFGYWPDAGWKPSTHYALAGTVPILFWNAGGIIFYTDAVDMGEDALTLVTVELARQYFLKNRGGMIARTLVPALSRIGVLAAGSKTADTARLQTHVGIATLLGMLGAS